MKHTDFKAEFETSAPVAQTCVKTAHLSALGLDLVDDTAENAIAALLAPAVTAPFS